MWIFGSKFTLGPVWVTTSQSQFYVIGLPWEFNYWWFIQTILLIVLGLTAILWVCIAVSLNTWETGNLIFPSDPSLW